MTNAVRFVLNRRVGVLLTAAALTTAGLGVAAAGSSVAAPADVLRAATADQLDCAARAYPASSAVDERTFTSTVSGIVQARLTGSGDWDLAVFDATTGKAVAGSAGYHTNELAEGFVTKGQKLLVQGCRFRGSAKTATLSMEFFAQPKAPSLTAQLVTVSTPTRAAKRTVQALGLDLAESGTATSLDVVLHGKADAAALRRAGLSYRVRTADLAGQSRRDRAADRTYAAQTAKSVLPSGRTSYRRLFDYQLEMKRLAIRYPTLVTELTLPERTVEGRSVEGIEITKNAPNLHDGKPVFLNMGVHHAREWPSAEHVLEFAYDLLHRYRAGGEWAKRIAATRTILIPVVNPDGFNISREAPSIGGDFSTFDYENKRKNCRATDSPAEYQGGTCGANPAGRERGTDLNRNYAGFWGGPGASADWADDTYRGARPFSEPETRNIRSLVSQRQVVTLITNHTFSGLVLRPPGVYDTRPSLEDKTYAKLGATLASHNGYDNQYSYELYDTTGATEDWSYWNTGGFGFTFEIGTVDFHPTFADAVVAEYAGLAPALGAGKGGNRAAYYAMLKTTADAAMHATLQGTAPKGSVLSVRKKFTTPTSPVIGTDGTTGKPITYTDVLTTSYTAPGGRFRFAVNPSTRPYVAGRLGRDPQAPAQTDLTLANPTGVPAVNQGDPLTGAAERIPFTVKGLPQADNGVANVTINWGSLDTDWDLYIVDSAGQIVASSANGGTTSETARLVDPPAGTYTAVIVNYDNGAAHDWNGGVVDFRSPLPTTYGPTETWTLTCSTPSGRVKATQQVFVARGQTLDLGGVCSPRSVKAQRKTNRPQS